MIISSMLRLKIFSPDLVSGATRKNDVRELEGIYFGYNVRYGANNVYLKPALASGQGVKGSVTNALAAAFPRFTLVAEKSFSNNLLVYYAVLLVDKL